MSRASLCDPFTPFQSPTAQVSPASVPSLLHNRNDVCYEPYPSPIRWCFAYSLKCHSHSSDVFVVHGHFRYISVILSFRTTPSQCRPTRGTHATASPSWSLVRVVLPTLVSFVEILVFQRGGQTLLGKGLCSANATLASVQRRAHVNHRWVITCRPHASTDALSQVLGRPIPLSDTSLPMLSTRTGHVGRWRSPSDYPLSYLYWLPRLLHSH